MIIHQGCARMKNTTVDDLNVDYVLDDFSRSMGGYRDILALIGAFYFGKWIFKGIYNIYRTVRIYLLPKVWYIRDFKKHYGEWAVVTGASEGLGRAFAIELAKKGMNVVIISRSYDKLKKVALDIANVNSECRVKIITADFNDIEEVHTDLKEKLADLEIGLLVNNVGIMYDKPKLFLDTNEEMLIKIVNLNITTTVLMTHLVLQQMVMRGYGGIINVASGAGMRPTPLMTAYAAAKTFVDYFTRALAFEYHEYDIDIQVIAITTEPMYRHQGLMHGDNLVENALALCYQSVNPYYVSTRMTGFAKPSIFVPSPEAYAAHAINTLPITRRCYGYWSHALMGAAGSIMPEWMFMWACVHVNKNLWAYLAGNGQQKVSVS